MKLEITNKDYTIYPRLLNELIDSEVVKEKGFWIVKNNKTEYKVFTKNGRFACTCPDFRFKGKIIKLCKHIIKILTTEDIPVEDVICYAIKNPEFFRVFKERRR